MDISNIVNFSKKHYMVVVSMVIMLACFVFMILNLGEREMLDSKYRDLSIEHGRILKNLKFGSGITEDLEAIAVSTDEAEAQLFEVKDLAGNYDYFYKLESDTGVKIAAMRQLGSANANARSVSARKERRAKYSKIGYDISIVGTFDQLVNYLRSLEGGKSHYRMDRILMSSAHDDMAPDNLQMNLAIRMLGVKIK